MNYAHNDLNHLFNLFINDSMLAQASDGMGGGEFGGGITCCNNGHGNSHTLFGYQSHNGCGDSAVATIEGSGEGV